MGNSETISPLAAIRGQLAIFRRVDHVHAAAQHRDGVAARGERAFVRGGIDAARHAADDGQAGARQVAREPFGHRQP
jgi:hypothetical protein